MAPGDRDGDDWGTARGSGRWTRYEFRPRIPVQGGLVHSRARGKMAESWWSQRFVGVLESYGLGGRMQRGRTYARQGQVVALDVGPGVISAVVQGSRRHPYQVVVSFPLPTAAQWADIDEVLAASVAHVARLSAGEVPEQLEDVFAAAGVALLPATWRDLRADCDCPDWGDPCKHVAAALYLFADQLDSDPWLLLAWRGRTRDEVLVPLRARAGESPAEQAGSVAVDHGLPPWWPLIPGRVEADATGRAARELDDVIEPPGDPSQVLTRLDPLDAQVRGVQVTDLLGPIYEAVVEDVDLG